MKRPLAHPPAPNRGFKQPLRFGLRLLWATSSRFRIALSFAIAAIALLLWARTLPAIAPFLGATGIFLSQPGVSTLSGAMLGASISLIVSITLQRDQFKAKSLLDKKEEIYAPLLRSVISFIQQLEARPYPWQIAHIGGALSFSLQPQAGFLTWSDIVSSGEVISVPSWLRRAFEALGANLDEYNRQVRACSHQIERSLIEELKERGLIESASGFSEISLILAEEYEARVITPFSQMKHPEGAGNRTQEEIAPLLPQLFREYGQLPAIEAIRVFYAEEVVDRARWLRRALENVIRLIELSYGSRDPHL